MGNQPDAKRVFGFPVTAGYWQAADGLFDIVAYSNEKGRYETSSTTPPESFRDMTTPLAGQRGLADALAKGINDFVLAQGADRARCATQ